MSNDSLIGSLTILSQVDSRVAGGLAKDQSRVEGFAASIGRVGGAIGSWRQIAVVGGAIAAAVKGLSDVDRLAAEAVKMGTTVNDLAALGYGASQTDVGVESLHGGLEKLLGTFGRAQGGSAAAVKGFNDLGFSIEELRGKSATELFGEVAQAVAEIEDPSIRVARAQAVMGKGAADLMPLLLRGRDGIKGFRTEADQLGLTLTKVQEEAVGKCNDEFDAMNAAAAGASRQLGAALAPALGELALLGRQLAQSIQPALPIVAALGNIVAHTAVGLTAIGTAATGFVLQVKALGALGLQKIGFDVDADQSIRDVIANRDAFMSLGQESEKAAGKIKATGEATKEAFEGADKLVSKWQSSVDTFGRSERVAEIMRVLQSGEATKEQAKQLALLDAKLRGLEREDALWKKITEWQAKLATFDMTDRQAQIDAIRQEHGDTPLVKNLDRIDRELTAKEQAKKLAEETARTEERAAERVKQIKEDSLTKEQKWAKEFAEVKSLWASGKLTDEEFQNWQKNNPQNGEANTLPFAGAALQGSNEARKILLHGATLGSRDPWAGLEKNSGKTVSQLEEMNRTLDRMARTEEETVKI